MFYMDINATRSMEQFVQLLGKTVIGKVDTFSQSAMRKINAFFASYKPTMSFDELTGIPTFSITVQPNQREESLKQILIICDYRKAYLYRHRRVSADSRISGG